MMGGAVAPAGPPYSTIDYHHNFHQKLFACHFGTKFDEFTKQFFRT
jgi:hypothetical protein